MLSILKRGTVQVGPNTWEFHQDSDQPNIFYVTPMPVFSLDANGLPRIQIATMQTSDPNTNGSGYCQIVVELGVPDGVLPGIIAQIQAMASLFGPVTAPVFQTLAVQPGTIVNVTFPDGAGSTTGAQVDGTDFGSDQAIFQLPLTADQVTAVTTAMSAKGGSPFSIEYILSVASFMPAVTAALSFNSNTFFNYTVDADTSWDEPTTYDITEYLNESNSSTVTVDKVDPSIGDDVIAAIRDWGQSVITQQVIQQVNAALALQSSASGTQSYNVTELTSFTETYAQNETISWRIRPQAVLPSFADLGLTVAQIQQLQITIDDRIFQLTVVPNVRFLSGDPPKSAPIQPGANAFLTNVAKVKQLDVTVSYPNLIASSATFTFTDNTPNVWQCKLDPSQLGVCSLSYVATYLNSDGTSQQVTGSMENIDVSTLTLELADIGIINVLFDATGFFKVPPPGPAPTPTGNPVSPSDPSVDSGKAEVESMNVNVVFAIDNEAPLLQSFVLDATTPTFVVSSPHSAPISDMYSYSVTYNFKPGIKAAPYTSDVITQNGAVVRIDGPTAVQGIGFMVSMGPAASPTFAEVDINVYYADTAFLPNTPAAAALSLPTQQSPIQFNIFAPDASGGTTARREMSIFSNSNMAPLIISATGVSGVDGSVTTWASQLDFSPAAVTSFTLFAANMFTFIEFDPSNVDWQIDPTTGVANLIHIILQISSVTVMNGATPKAGQVATSTQTIAWNPTVSKCPTAVMMIQNLGPQYDSISVNWNAQYVYHNLNTPVTVSGTVSTTTVVLPQTATAAKSSKR